jgi:hypothetical protein
MILVMSEVEWIGELGTGEEKVMAVERNGKQD